MAVETDGWGRRKGKSAYDCDTVIVKFCAQTARTARDVADEIRRRFPDCRDAIPQHLARLAEQGYLDREKKDRTWVYKVSDTGKRSYHA